LSILLDTPAARVAPARAPATGRGSFAWKRWATWALAAIAIVYVLYLVAANVILRTGLLRGWLNVDENKMRLAYDSAWSLVPGRVEARGLSLRYQDNNLQMLLGLPRATVKIDLLALPSRTFRVSELTAEGATYRMRQKVESVAGQEERVRAFPPIEGFADPPIEHEVEEPPIPDAEYKLWTIDVRGISASVREVWTLEFRYRGEATLHGAFHVKSRREMWVEPSVMITRGGLFSLGERELVRGGESRLEVRLDRFDVRQVHGAEVLRYLSASVHQQGELVASSIPSTYVPADAKLEVTRGVGPMTLDVGLEHGVLAPSTRVTFHTDDVAVSATGIKEAGDLELSGKVVPAPGGAGAASVVLETAITHAAGIPLEIENARGSVDLGNADLTAPFRIANASGSVARAHSADMRAWQPFAPPDTTFDGGSATVAARGDYREGALEGRVDLAMDRAGMSIGPFSFSASGKSWTNVIAKDAAKAITFPASGVDLHDVALRLKDARTRGVWLRSTFEGARLTPSGPAAGFDMDIAARSGPGDRTLALFTRLATLPDVAASAASGTHLDAALHLRVRPTLISLGVKSSKNGPLESHGRLQKRKGHPATGAFLLDLSGVRSGLAFGGGSFALAPLAGDAWLEEKLETQ